MARAVVLDPHEVPNTKTPSLARRPQPDSRTAVTLIDCDVHNYPDSIQDLLPFLSERWLTYIEQTGFEGPTTGLYPKGFKLAARRDAWPPTGVVPGADPNFSRNQLLDTWQIDYAILNPLYYVNIIRNPDFAIALARAVNEWTANVWLEHDSRWRGSIVVTPQHPTAAAEEIRRAGQDPRFVQVLLHARSELPFGQRQLHPIFEAACDMGLRIGIHFSAPSLNPITAAGWPSYYIEDHTGMTQAFEAQVISLVAEGVFERFPTLRVAIVEGGFAWLPALMWRFDKNYKALRDEVPWLTKLPSDYIRTHFRATSQPMEEPSDPRHLLQIIEMIGSEDFLMFATDYPHWDFDSPDRALPSIVPNDLRQKIMATTANDFYDFNRT